LKGKIRKIIVLLLLEALEHLPEELMLVFPAPPLAPFFDVETDQRKLGIWFPIGAIPSSK
jgi:hypothetical protein